MEKVNVWPLFAIFCMLSLHHSASRPSGEVMTKPTSGAPRRSRRRRQQRLTKKSVLKMLRVMSAGGGTDEADPVKDFLSTGRIGRRNALPNILSEHALTTTADLPDQLSALTTSEKGGDKESEMRMGEEGEENRGDEAAGGPSS